MSKQAVLYEGIDDFPYLKWIRFCKDDLGAGCSKSGLIDLVKVRLLQNKIRAQVIDRFGINPDLKDYLEKKADLELMYIDQVFNPDPSQLVFQKMLEIDIQEIENKEAKDVNDMHSVSRYLGFPLHKEISIAEFFGYIQNINKDVRNKEGVGKST